MSPARLRMVGPLRTYDPATRFVLTMEHHPGGRLSCDLVNQMAHPAAK